MRYRAMRQVKRMGMYYLLWVVLKLYSYEAGNWDSTVEGRCGLRLEHT